MAPPTPPSLHMPPSTPGVFLLLRHSKSVPTSAFIPSVPSAWNASPCFLRAEALPSCGHQGLSGPCVLWRLSLTTGILRSVQAGSMSACSCCSPVPRNVPGGQGELSKYLWFGWRDRQTTDGKSAAVPRGQGLGQPGPQSSIAVGSLGVGSGCLDPGEASCRGMQYTP